MISGISIDTRTLKPGNLYIPIVGERLNGHAFAEQAIASGAAAMLWSREQPHPPLGKIPVLFVDDTLLALQGLAREYRRQLDATVIGITGSNGKTSTKDIAASCLAEQYRTQKTAGNLNNHIGVPLTLLGLDEHTEAAVVEMGMSGLGEIALLSDIAQPDIAIITNIGEAHIGDLGSKRLILQAKLEIASGLKPGGLLLYNGDDELLATAGIASGDKYRAASFGLEAGNDYRAAAYTLDQQGTRFAVSAPHAPEYTLPLAGKHQLLNALAAIAAATQAGVSEEQIRTGLVKATLSGMRNEIVRAGSCTIINDTYKSNPSSAEAALATLYLFGGSRQRIAVLGDMQDLGEQAVSLHHHVGSFADPDRLDFLFAYGPLSIHTADHARRNMRPERVVHYEDKTLLIAHLRSVIEPDAVVLVKASRDLKLEEVVSAIAGERHEGGSGHAAG